VTKKLDRQQTAGQLNVTLPQLERLRRNPTFPKPIEENDEWDLEDYICFFAEDEIEQFRQRMAAVADEGWVMPEALYRWPGW
jgi:hypothetical protein